MGEITLQTTYRYNDTGVLCRMAYKRFSRHDTITKQWIYLKRITVSTKFKISVHHLNLCYTDCVKQWPLQGSYARKKPACSAAGQVRHAKFTSRKNQHSVVLEGASQEDERICTALSDHQPAVASQQPCHPQLQVEIGNNSIEPMQHLFDIVLGTGVAHLDSWGVFIECAQSEMGVLRDKNMFESGLLSSKSWSGSKGITNE